MSGGYALVSTTNEDEVWRLPPMDFLPAARVRPRVPTCAVMCAIFSFVGALFLGVLGRLVQLRYPYVKIRTDDPDNTASSLYVASSVYALFAIVCILLWLRVLRRQRQYDDENWDVDTAAVD